MSTTEDLLQLSAYIDHELPKDEIATVQHRLSIDFVYSNLYMNLLNGVTLRSRYFANWLPR